MLGREEGKNVRMRQQGMMGTAGID